MSDEAAEKGQYASVTNRADHVIKKIRGLYVNLAWLPLVTALLAIFQVAGRNSIYIALIALGLSFAFFMIGAFLVVFKRVRDKGFIWAAGIASLPALYVGLIVGYVIIFKPNIHL